jgi:hypothetical protein
LPPTISLKAGTEATRKMRELLLRHPEVITVVSQHGRPDNGSDASPFSNVELFAPLKPFEDWPANLTKEKSQRDTRCCLLEVLHTSWQMPTPRQPTRAAWRDPAIFNRSFGFFWAAWWRPISDSAQRLFGQGLQR